VSLQRQLEHDHEPVGGQSEGNYSEGAHTRISGEDSMLNTSSL
jgi:hypothetical protein